MSAIKLMSELNRLKDVALLDWPSPAMHVYETPVGHLTIRVTYTPAKGQWTWELLHPRAGYLSQGSSETREVAKLEAITYALEYVRQGKLQGLLA